MTMRKMINQGYNRSGNMGSGEYDMPATAHDSQADGSINLVGIIGGKGKVPGADAIDQKASKQPKAPDSHDTGYRSKRQPAGRK
jgi:hypothetical protein